VTGGVVTTEVPVTVVKYRVVVDVTAVVVGGDSGWFGNPTTGTAGNANCCRCGDGVATPSRM